MISHRYQEEEDTPPIKHFPHLFQTDASGCPRLEIKSKLISKSSRPHCVDRYPCGKLCENILADHQSCGLPGSSTLCDALVHVLALVQIDHLYWSRKLVSKLRKQNYQVQAKTRPWQRRHPVASIIILCVPLAVEREAVAIRGSGSAQKVPMGEYGEYCELLH